MSHHRPWHKSSYSGGSGAECVEVAEGDTVFVRDTQNRELGHIEYSPAEWTSFLHDLKAGPLQ
ncbi:MULTISPECIES: DUF397 domain-containing protein [Nocardiopsis]|uniref:DUF397 domain-containing protein n=1 Tax=Nocardiopsis sinuspersici TaxID=501010 RepID=A0A1V3C5J0_9ACTN|nr:MULTISPECIES: DUF397 domain-containing protein [Nocardiopsis]OOC55902.1 DUF397 domain-containing protein [Nocardiopsis sinuspersici]